MLVKWSAAPVQRGRLLRCCSQEGLRKRHLVLQHGIKSPLLTSLAGGAQATALSQTVPWVRKSSGLWAELCEAAWPILENSGDVPAMSWLTRKVYNQNRHPNRQAIVENALACAGWAISRRWPFKNAEFQPTGNSQARTKNSKLWFYLFVWVEGSCCGPGWPVTHCIDQLVLNAEIQLPLPFECWN